MDCEIPWMMHWKFEITAVINGSSKPKINNQLKLKDHEENSIHRPPYVQPL